MAPTSLCPRKDEHVQPVHARDAVALDHPNGRLELPIRPRQGGRLDVGKLLPQTGFVPTGPTVVPRDSGQSRVSTPACAGDELVVTRLSRMARSVRHLTEVASLLAERGVDLVVLKQGIDTTTPAGRFLFHVIGAMDEMLADLISEGTLEGLEAARARGRTGGRKPKLTERQVRIARQMYDETGADGKRRNTVAEIAETFHVSRKTIYRHLDRLGRAAPADQAQ
jgi:hypothetical protein